jgi:hypothetical protein
MEKNRYLSSMKILFLITFLSLNALAHEAQFAVKGKLKRGEKTTLVQVELETFDGARINSHAPISLELPKAKFSRNDFSILNNNTLRLEIESKDLSRKIEARMIFYLCFKNTCKKIDHHFIISG